MKKAFVGILMISLLTGCGERTKEETNTNIIFKEELAMVSEIGELKGKKLADEILIEDVNEIFKGIFDLAIFESSTVEYGEVLQGAGPDGNGGRVFCCKLPAIVKFTGSEESVEKFVEYFEELDNLVSFGEFNVECLEDGKYKVTTLINFLGKATGGSLSSGKKEYTIKKNEKEVKKEEDITLREFDISMVIRPSNSDASAISLGVVSDKDYRIYSDENMKKDVNVTFSNVDNKYYCEYNIGDGLVTKAEIKPSGNILFDILSCEVVKNDDEIATDLHIINNSNKKVSICTYDDDDKRINVVEKVGNVEVKKQ